MFCLKKSFEALVVDLLDVLEPDAEGALTVPHIGHRGLVSVQPSSQGNMFTY